MTLVDCPLLLHPPPCYIPNCSEAGFPEGIQQEKCTTIAHTEFYKQWLEPSLTYVDLKFITQQPAKHHNNTTPFLTSLNIT